MRFSIAFVLFFATVSTVTAHPHVWIKARAELILNSDEQLTAVRHVWQFDDAFSAFATQGLDENNDGVFSRDELTELSKVNMESLVDFEFFTFVQMGDKDPAYVVPSEFWLQHDGALLTLFFTLPMREPVAADAERGYQDLTVEVFDPTFFVDISFVNDDPVILSRIDGEPSVCDAHMQHRKGVSAIESKLLAEIGPDVDIPEELAPQQGDLSNTMRISCTPS